MFTAQNDTTTSVEEIKLLRSIPTGTPHRVQRHRESLGLNITELAKWTGLSTKTISSIEHRSLGEIRCRTKHEVAEILAEAFGCHVEDLFYPSELTNQGGLPLNGQPLSACDETWRQICETCLYECARNGSCHCE